MNTTTRHLSVTVVQGDLESRLQRICLRHITAVHVIQKNCSEGLEISRKSDFKKHLNKYDVIHLDVQWCMMDLPVHRLK